MMMILMMVFLKDSEILTGAYLVTEDLVLQTMKRLRSPVSVSLLVKERRNGTERVTMWVEKRFEGAAEEG